MLVNASDRLSSPKRWSKRYRGAFMMESRSRIFIHLLPLVLIVGGCASNHTLPARPAADDIAQINDAAKDHWVVITCTDKTQYEGNHFAMTDSAVELLSGGNRLTEKDG